jgi:hypothetical protein
MKRTMFAVAAGLLVASAASAQSIVKPLGFSKPLSFAVGGGVSTASRSWGVDLERGYHVTAMADLRVPMTPVAVRAELMYQRLGVPNADALAITSGGVAATYDLLPTPVVHVYAVGGAGLYRDNGAGQGGHSNFGASAGAGVRFPVMQMRLFVEGRYHVINNMTNVVPVSVGILF